MIDAENEIIKLRDVSFTYRGEQEVHAVRGVSLSVRGGEFAALIGANGSGKSTLARLLNGLLTPTKGTVTVDGMDTSDAAHLFDIRRTLGMVFQNPDNQQVAAIIEDDVAFGPENVGVPSAEIRERVDAALRATGMYELKDKTAARLSGGQKQRVAIAGALALRPKILVLDESTAMLDPKGRREVMDTVKRLNAEGMTILLITHFMEEAAEADTVFIMHEGRIVRQGAPRMLVGDENLAAWNLARPRAALLADLIRAQGVPLPSVLNESELTDELNRLL